jgi:hypothetical protein
MADHTSRLCLGTMANLPTHSSNRINEAAPSQTLKAQKGSQWNAAAPFFDRVGAKTVTRSPVSFTSVALTGEVPICRDCTNLTICAKGCLSALLVLSALLRNSPLPQSFASGPQTRILLIGWVRRGLILAPPLTQSSETQLAWLAWRLAQSSTPLRRSDALAPGSHSPRSCLWFRLDCESPRMLRKWTTLCHIGQNSPAPSTVPSGSRLSFGIQSGSDGAR